MIPENNTRNMIILAAILAATALFYLPFIPRQFMGDDWLWLYNAQKSWDHPIAFFERPMYGYFRPLNMFMVAVLLKAVGMKPILYGLGNLFLHLANIFALYALSRRLGLERKIALGGSFFFAFYFISAPVVGWVATGHDIWVTLLSLVFSYLTLEFIGKPGVRHFLLLWLVGFSALLIKESGFVTLGLYLALFLLERRSPIGRRFWVYTVLIASSYLAYLAIYAVTRTYVDRELDIGPKIAVNLWYFIGYILMPLSERITAMIPQAAAPLLKAGRILITIIVPLAGFLIARRGPKAIKFFALWMIVFLSTTAIMQWDFSLFSLYPERTAARFMYTAATAVGMIISWFILQAAGRLMRWPRAVSIFMVLLVIAFIGANFIAAGKTLRIYRERQAEISNVLSGLEPASRILANGETLTILADTCEGRESIVQSGAHMRAMMAVAFDRDIEVRVEPKTEIPGDEPSRPGVTLVWDNAKRRFMP